LQDLLLYQHQALDSSVSNSAVKAFSRHLRYVTLEMVPLSLFSGKLSEVEKPELADCLLALKPKKNNPLYSTGYGKSSFPEKILTVALLWHT